MSTVNEQAIDTGNTIQLLVNNKNVIGRAQSMSAEREYGTTGIYEIGTIMPTEHAFLKFTGSLNLERIRLKKSSLAHAGLVGLGEDILGTPVFTISTVDRYTGEVGISYVRCSADSYSEAFRANDTVQETARFFFCASTGRGDYAPKYTAPKMLNYGVI